MTPVLPFWLQTAEWDIDDDANIVFTPHCPHHEFVHNDDDDGFGHNDDDDDDSIKLNDDDDDSFGHNDGNVKHLPHQPNQSKSNLSRQAPLFQQEADEKVISQQANQTLWLFHNRQDQTLWLFFVAVPLVIPQCIQSQSCTEDGNENPVLHTIPQQPQTSTLSSGSVA